MPGSGRMAGRAGTSLGEQWGLASREPPGSLRGDKSNQETETVEDL